MRILSWILRGIFLEWPEARPANPATVPGLRVRGLWSVFWDLEVGISEASSGTDQVPREVRRP